MTKAGIKLAYAHAMRSVESEPGNLYDLQSSWLLIFAGLRCLELLEDGHIERKIRRDLDS